MIKTMPALSTEKPKMQKLPFSIRERSERIGERVGDRGQEEITGYIVFSNFSLLLCFSALSASLPLLLLLTNSQPKSAIKTFFSCVLSSFTFLFCLSPSFINPKILTKTKQTKPKSNLIPVDTTVHINGHINGSIPNITNPI